MILCNCDEQWIAWPCSYNNTRYMCYWKFKKCKCWFKQYLFKDIFPTIQSIILKELCPANYGCCQNNMQWFHYLNNDLYCLTSQITHTYKVCKARIADSNYIYICLYTVIQ